MSKYGHFFLGASLQSHASFNAISSIFLRWVLFLTRLKSKRLSFLSDVMDIFVVLAGASRLSSQSNTMAAEGPN